MSSVRKSVLDCETLDKQVHFRLPMMNNTRWNSQYQLIEKLIQAIEICSSLQEKLNACKKHGSLSQNQIKMLKELLLLLGPIKQATDAFQKANETIGLVIPAYLDVSNRVTLDPKLNPDCGSITSKECNTFAEALKTSIVERMDSCLKDYFFVIGKKPNFLIWLSR